jgi:hypothetical protein
MLFREVVLKKSCHGYAVSKKVTPVEIARWVLYPVTDAKPLHIFSVNLHCWMFLKVSDLQVESASTLLKYGLLDSTYATLFSLNRSYQLCFIFFPIWVHMPWSMLHSQTVSPDLPNRCFRFVMIFFSRSLSPLGI